MRAQAVCRLFRGALWLAAAFVSHSSFVDSGCAGDSPPSSGAVAATRLPSVHIQNLWRVSTNVFSGGSPDSDAAFLEIAKLGVKTIVSVDGARPDIARAHTHGLRYIHLPFGYDGVPEQRVAELAKVAESSRGPLFVHCHHGLHRGPAAAALICQAGAGWTTNQAVSWLNEAGTSHDYPGLYRSVAAYRPTARTILAKIGELPELARATSLVEAMVAIDGQFEHLNAAAKSGWSNAGGHPQDSPATAATLLWEHFRELARLEDTARRPGDYRDKLADSERAAAELKHLLYQSKPDAPALDQALAVTGRTCAACHKRHRD